MKVNESTVLSEVLKIKGAEEVLAKHKLPCLSCPMASMELGMLKLGEVCRTYGIDVKKVLQDLKKLNKK